MKQVLQYLDSGELHVADVPTPAVRNGGVLVQTVASLISVGTERSMVDLGRKGLVGKARSRPDLVKQVVDKARKEGVLNTVSAVRARLEEPLLLGYSAAGEIIEIGPGVNDLQVGDRVAIAGAGYANHAEVNFVPRNLVAKIPSGVAYQDAAYTTVASIALNGVRLAGPRIGDAVVVIGLGLVGLITVQLLRANGCRVFGVDLNPSKVAVAQQFGARALSGENEAVCRAVDDFTRGRGADSVLITASTKSNGPLELAGLVSRRRGKVVVVGAVGMTIPRDVYYPKEIQLRVSMSYGPGRYDSSYEQDGIDYPYEFVRWTENRNMEAVLSLLDEKRLNFSALTTHRFTIDRATEAYELIDSGGHYIGVILDYDVARELSSTISLTPEPRESRRESLRIGFIGAGNYATLHLIPVLQKNPAAQLQTLVTATGPSARKKAEKFGFSVCSTETGAIFDNDEIDSVFIATRHATHASLVVRALQAGKHVFVEKPVAVTEAELQAVQEAYEEASQSNRLGLMVGLNRRFSSMVREIKTLFPNEQPLVMLYRVNSGHIPIESWVYEQNEGGGMLVGESCHFFDVMTFICGSRPMKVYAGSIKSGRVDVCDSDNLSVTVTYENGSVGTLIYSTVGSKTLPKERFEAYGSGRAATLNDFRQLTYVKDGSKKRVSARNQDKGQSTQLLETIGHFRQGTSPIPFAELVQVMKVVFAAKQSLRRGEPVDLWE